VVSDTLSAAVTDASLVHDAFISYSRKDKGFARKLDKALKAYTPPRALDVPQRHLDVFRDEEDFTGADYHASIARHLSASRKLLLLCSPHARASRYVDDEVRRFAELRGAANIIPLLVGGLPNNETAPGQEDQAAFPAGLCETLEMPLAIEYRGFDPRRDAVTKGAFEGAWHTTLASLYDKTRSQVEQRERKRTARRRRITSTIVASIVSVLLAALVVSLFYWRQAVEQRTAAVARQLAAQAELVRNQRPDFIVLSVLLATESLKRQPSLEAEMALRPQLALLPRPVLTIQDPAANATFNPARMVFSADRKYVATASVQDVSVWELMTGRQVARMAPQYPLVGLAFSPRADYLVTGSGSDVFAKPYVAQVWHLPDGREVSRLPQQSAPPKRLAFGGNGESLATVDKQVLRLWDPASGRAVAALQQDDPIEDLAFSPDGQRIATIAAGGVATMWSVQDGKKILSMTHAKGLSAVLFSPDGTLIATSADDTRMWRAADGHEMFRVPAGGQLRFSPDGRRFTVEGRGTLGVYDATNGERLTALTQADAIEDVNFQPDAVYVATEAFKAGIARVWRGRLGEKLLQRYSDDDMSRDFAASELTRIVQEHVDFAAFSPDASHFATGDAAGRLQLWKSTAAAEVAALGHDDLVIPLGFSQDNSRLVTAGSGIRGIWELASGRQASHIPIEVYPDTVGLSPGDARFLLVLDANRTVTVLEAATGRKVVVLKEAGPDDAFAFSADGSRLAAAGREDDTARVWEIPSGRQLLKLPPMKSLDAVLFSPNGASLLTVSGENNLVVIWNAATGQEVARITDKKGLAHFTFTADSRYLAAWNREPDGLTRVWELGTGRERMRVTHETAVTTLAFSPDGRYLATGGLDSPPRVWNVEGGTLAATLVRATMVSGMYSEMVVGLEFTPDGRLVVASADGIVSVWDPRGWREAGRIQHKSQIAAMTVSRNGRLVAAGLDDGVVRVSFLSPADLIAEACARLTRNLTADEWRQYLGDEPYAATCPNLPLEQRSPPAADGRGAKPGETR
jgi:WD40 repeat protein